MATRNVVLTEKQDALVDELIREGRYQSASEVLRDALRLLGDKRARQRAELADIRSGLIEGLGQAEDGIFADGDGKDAIHRAFHNARIERHT